MKKEKLLKISRLILYFTTPFFIGVFFNLLGRVESHPDYFFLKLGFGSLVAALLCYWIEHKLTKSVKEIPK